MSGRPPALLTSLKAFQRTLSLRSGQRTSFLSQSTLDSAASNAPWLVFCQVKFRRCGPTKSMSCRSRAATSRSALL